MGKRLTISVQEFQGRGYSKVCGVHVSPSDGKPRPKVWYFLSVDHAEACRRAAWLKAEWSRLKGHGVKAWPHDFQPPWKASEALPLSEPTPWMGNAPQRLQTNAGAAPKLKAITASRATVKDAFNLYRAAKEREADAGTIGLGRVSTIKNFVARTVEYLGEETLLAAVGSSELVNLAEHFKARPNKDDGKPISVAYAESLIVNAASFFRWISAKGQLGWTLPNDFEEIFSLKNKPIRPKTEAEKKKAYLEKRGDRIDVVSVSDLGKLYKAADETVRAWMLIALNAACRQKEISEFRTYYLKKDGKFFYIDYDRSKTGEQGVTRLWPETVKAIEATRAEQNPHERIWLRPSGELLVTETVRGRSDYIRRQWDKVRSVAGVSVSFDSLRDTSATMIYHLSGSRKIQMAHEAHSEAEKMALHYADRDWSELHKWQDELRKALAPVWAKAKA